jgi:uncharacterized membrane protein YhdT
VLATFDFVANIVVPIGVITLANVYLIVRILWQRRHQRASIHRHWKLSLQLLSVAMLYILFWTPAAVNGLVGIFSPSDLSLELQENYFLTLTYMVVTFLPMVSLLFLPSFTRTLFGLRSAHVLPANTLQRRPRPEQGADCTLTFELQAQA